MADLSFIFGVIGNVISILVFISPVKTFWCIVKNNSTQDFKSLPYICTLLSTSLWTYYGLIKPGGLLIATVNGAGAALEAAYVILYIIYTPKERKVSVEYQGWSEKWEGSYRIFIFVIAAVMKLKTVLLVLLVDIVFYVVVFMVTFLALNQHMRVTVIGVLCVCLTLSMYGSPLVIMRTVIATKSVEFMPFFLSFFLFLNGGVWAVWAVLEQDVFVGIPNGIGFGLGAAQLLLYVIYRKGEPRLQGIKEEDVKSNGLKHVARDIEIGVGDELCSDYIAGSKSHPNNLQMGSSLP